MVQILGSLARKWQIFLDSPFSAGRADRVSGLKNIVRSRRWVLLCKGSSAFGLLRSCQVDRQHARLYRGQSLGRREPLTGFPGEKEHLDTGLGPLVPDPPGYGIGRKTRNDRTHEREYAA